MILDSSFFFLHLIALIVVFFSFAVLVLATFASWSFAQFHNLCDGNLLLLLLFCFSKFSQKRGEPMAPITRFKWLTTIISATEYNGRSHCTCATQSNTLLYRFIFLVSVCVVFDFIQFMCILSIVSTHDSYIVSWFYKTKAEQKQKQQPNK